MVASYPYRDVQPCPVTLSYRKDPVVLPPMDSWQLIRAIPPSHYIFHCTFSIKISESIALGTASDRLHSNTAHSGFANLIAPVAAGRQS